MNAIKKILGLVWLLLGPTLVSLMIWQANDKIGKAAEGVAKTNTTLQWGIILFIFIPISIGMMIFGWYALKGEYAHLPESSDEITD
jgi:Na+/H+ antiporter NhaA